MSFKNHFLFVADVQQSEAAEMINTVGTVTAAPDMVDFAPPKYDDPYEENPIMSKCLCNGIEQKSAESEVIVTAERCRDASSSEISVEREMSRCSLVAGVVEPSGEQKTEVGASTVPVRSFELSAEYGGFFVVPEPSVNKAVTTATQANTTEQHQQAAAGQLAGQRVDSSSIGLYDKPWDLSTVKHSITERLHRTSQKDVVGRPDSNCRQPLPPLADVYAQPNKGDKQRQRYRIEIEPGIGDGPSYGVLCERISDDNEINAPPPPLVRRQAGTHISNSQRGTTWTTGNDLRPLDDYDAPWDQKKKFGGQAGKKQIYSVASGHLNRPQYSSCLYVSLFFVPYGLLTRI